MKRFALTMAVTIGVTAWAGLACDSANAQVPGFRRNAASAAPAAGQAPAGDPTAGGTAMDIPSSVDMRPWYLRSPLSHIYLPIPRPPLPRFLRPAGEGEVRVPLRERLGRPRQVIANGGRRIANATRQTWQQTKDLFTFDTGNQQPPPRVAQSNEQPGFWSRLFGGEESQEPQGPQTMAEWMAQERLDP